MSKTIAICNEKGGVGKTTTTLNLGAGLTRLGFKVLLVDADPQGNLTNSLGWKDQNQIQISLARKMKEAIAGFESDPDDVILHHREGMDLIPTTLELSNMDTELINAFSRELTLKRTLEPYQERYDYILIDCKPDLGLITVNSLCAADSVIIPVEAEYLSAVGMTQLLHTIMQVREHINPTLNIEGILFTKVENNTNMARATKETVRNSYGDQIRIFQTEIPKNVRIQEAPTAGESVYAYDARCAGAQAYEEFAKEVMANG